MRTVLSLQCLLLVELEDHCSTGKCTALRLKHSPGTYISDKISNRIKGIEQVILMKSTVSLLECFSVD